MTVRLAEGKLIKLAQEDGKTAVPNRVQLLRVGNFLQETGGKIQITTEMLRSLKKNFDGNARDYEDGHLPIDYFHENDRVACGWIEKVALENNDSELWIDVDWTPKARQMLSDKELRYISAEFSTNYRHNEGGKTFGPTLFGAGLTNRPFIKGMKPVVNLSEGDKTMDLEQALAKIKELEAEISKLKGGQSAEMGEAKKALEEAKKELSELKTKAAEDKATSEKKGKFDKMLSEGKVCEAQRDPFMKDDMVAFSEKSQPTNRGAGHGGTGGKVDDDAGESKTPAQDQLLTLAEKAKKEKNISQAEAIDLVLSENPKLAKDYQKEVAVH